MQRYLAATVLLAAALGGCAGEDGKAGPRGAEGAPCTVTTSGNTAVITCPDGSSSTIDPGSCTVASNGDGTHTITCPGGSTVVHDGEQLERGTITGTASRWGLPAEAGIEATLVELDRTVATDANGRFTFNDVRPGLYRIHLSFPGYAPADLPNVAIVGGSVDLGATELKMGRLIARGAVAPLLSPGETKMALRKDFIFSSAGDLSLLDLASGEEQFVSSEAQEADFLGERYLVVSEARADSGSDLVIFDADSGERTYIGRADSFRILAGGVLWSDGTQAHFRAVPGTTNVDLDFDWFGENTEDRRYVVLRKWNGQQIGLFDSQTGTVQTAQMALQSDFVFSYSTGRIAFFPDAEAEPGSRALAMLDPATGLWSLWSAPSDSTLLSWSADGQRFAFLAGGSVHVHEFTEGGSSRADLREVVPSAYGATFSPTGRLIAISASDGSSVVLDRSVGTTWTVPNSWVSFGPGDRWISFVTNEGMVVIDTTSPTTRMHAGQVSEHRFSSSGDQLLISGEGKLWRLDLATGEENLLASTGDWRFSSQQDRVVFVDSITGLLSIADLVTGAVTPTNATGMLRDWSGDESALFVGDGNGGGGPSGETVSLLDVDGGTLLPVDEKILELMGARTGFAYWAGEIPMFPAVAAAPGSNLFDDMGLYWAAYP